MKVATDLVPRQTGTTVYAEANGAPGGTADDTQALQNLIDQVDSWTTIVLSNRRYNVQADALQWNKNGVVLSGPVTHASNTLSFADPGDIQRPMISFLSGGAFGIKIGALANYELGQISTNFKRGCGIVGVKLSGGNFTFTEGFLTLYGLQYAFFSPSIRYVTGRAMYMRAFWDSELQPNILSCNNATEGIVVFGALYGDDGGDNNNLRWHHGFMENCNGTYFYSEPGSQLALAQFNAWKFEVGSVTPPPSTKRVFDLIGDHVDIYSNWFTSYNSTRGYDAILRVSGVFNRFHENHLGNCTGYVLWNLAGADGTYCRNNFHLGTSTNLDLRNESNYQLDFEYPTHWGDDVLDGRGINASRRLLNLGVSPVSVHEFGTTPQNCYVPELFGGAQNIQKSVFRNTITGAGVSPLLLIPMALLKDSAFGKTIIVRARRTQDGGTPALRLLIKSAVIQGSAFTANPTALTGVSFVGNGTNCTATKTAHGFINGDRIIVTGTTNFNSPANQPYPIFASANTFTFAHTFNGSSDTDNAGNAQRCAWSNIQFPVLASAVANLGNASTDRCRIEYGAGNDQPIDLDTVEFLDLPIQQATFTPVAIGTTAAGAGTYTKQVGRFTRVMDRVMFYIRIAWTAHTGTGSLTIGGLPYVANNVSTPDAPCTIIPVNLTYNIAQTSAFPVLASMVTMLCAQVANGTTTILILEASAGAGLALVPMDTAAELIISGQYEAVS
jgi:hypothetical protein